jgi:antitoxin FitA
MALPAGQSYPDSICDSNGSVLARILIRQLEERVVEILRARAQRRGLSLEQSLRELLTAAAAEQDDLSGRLAELRRQTPASGRQLDVAGLIREERKQR